MSKSKQNTKRIGNYVSLDSSSDADYLLPLLECLRFAVVLNRKLDYFLEGIFTGKGPCGGDPGWVIERVLNDDGSVKYSASISEDFCDPPNYCEYSETVVKKHIRATIENFRKVHPERTHEVDAVVNRFSL